MNDNERSLPRGAAAGAKDGRSIGTSVMTAALRVAGRFALAMERSQQRRAMRGLSDHQLRDIGLTRGDLATSQGYAKWLADEPAGEQRPAVIHNDLSRAA